MKRRRLEADFLDQLEKTPIISVACKKTGLSRQTIYRWKNIDPKFAQKIIKGITLGIDSVSDLAESQIIQLIKNGNFKALKYWLDNHKSNYMNPRPRDFWEKIYEQHESDIGGLFIINKDRSIKYRTQNKTYDTNLIPDSAIFRELEEKHNATIFKVVDFKKHDNSNDQPVVDTPSS